MHGTLPAPNNSSHLDEAADVSTPSHSSMASCAQVGNRTSALLKLSSLHGMNPPHAVAVQLQLSAANSPDEELSGFRISYYFALLEAVSGAHKRLQQLEAWQPKMDAALHEQRAASALQSDASRPSTSTSSSSLASFGRSRGLATTCSQTYSRLGYVSPSYADKHATSHGIIGMSGYLSVPHLTLAPTIPNGLGERVLAAAAAARPGNGQQRPKPRGASSSARQYRRLGQKDLQYLKDNEERNQQVSCPSQDWHARCRPGAVASGCKAHSSLLHLVCVFRCSSSG